MEPYAMMKPQWVKSSPAEFFWENKTIFTFPVIFRTEMMLVLKNRFLMKNHWECILNSLAPGRFQRNCRKVIFQLILMIGGLSISCKIVLKWMPMDLTDGKSTLVQVMAWCRQATSHYLGQCWPRSLSPYGVIRPQWVKWILHPDWLLVSISANRCQAITQPNDD